MIKIKDSLKLASTKFKTRKVRNILSAISVSLGIVLILSALIASSGVTTFGASIFKDTMQGRFFVRDYGQSYSFERAEDGAPPKNELVGKSHEAYINEYKKYSIERVFEERESTNYLGFQGQKYSFGGSDDYGMGAVTMTATEEIFAKDIINTSYSFADTYDGKIPVTVPFEYLASIERMTDRGANSREKFEKTQSLVKKYIGTTVRFDEFQGTESQNYMYPSKPFDDDSSTSNEVKSVLIQREFIIVGVSTQQFFGYSSLDSQFVIPNWAVSKYTDLASLLPAENVRFIAEFKTKKARDTFHKERQQVSRVDNLISRLEAFQEPINIMRKVALAIGGFLLVISGLFILTTLSKIVSDSRREIGVFRAVGGQRRDIKKIFLSYAFLLITLGYIIGFTISVLLTTLISLKWGDPAFYSIVNFGNTTDIKKPFLLFVSMPVLQMLALYVFVLLVGFIAAYLPARKASRIDPIKALREE